MSAAVGAAGRFAAGAFCAAALLATGAEAAGLALGAVAGVPLIGRPLQLTVPATIGPDESNPCLRAELLQGDGPATPLPGRLEPVADGRALVRLVSSQPVEEPVLTVRLTIGCRDQLTRTYVLLAEPAPAREPALALVPATQLAAFAPAVAAPPAPAAAPAGRQPDASARARPAARDVSPTEATKPRAKPRPAQQRPAQAAARPTERHGQPKLTLDLLDLEIDQAPALRMATELAKAAPGGMTRSEAGLAWQAANTTPEQLTALAQLVKNNEAELRRLRDVTQRQSVQLEQVSAERDRVRNVLIGLALLGGAVLFGAVLLAWWRARRAARQEPWWKEDERQPSGSGVPEGVEDVDSSWSALPLEDAPPRPAATSMFGPSMLGGNRLARAEELLDIQEKASFFLAVGQQDQAIELLESRLADHLDSPFLWLDLLDLCRRLNRPNDYERVRHRFRQTFAARLPAFDDVHPGSAGLQEYPRALSRIVLLWPSPRVLQEIEASLFQEPAPGSIPFDLEASRELLLLYSIANDLLQAEEEGEAYEPTLRAPLQTGSTEPVPLTQLDTDYTQPVPLTALDAPAGPQDQPPSLDLDLDLDFSLDLDVSPPADLAAVAELDLDLTQPAVAR